MSSRSDRRADDYMTPSLDSWRRRTDGPLVVIALGTLPLLLLELVRDRLVTTDRVTLDVVGVIVFGAFAVDFIVELWLSKRRSLYFRREWLGLIVVAAQGLALIPAFAAVGALRALRGARVVGLIAALLRPGSARQLRRHAAGLALGTAGMVWITAAVAFTLAEDVGAGGRVDSFFDALWWSSATITTVGYGDVFPVTAVGRIIGVITMVVGISAFAVVTAKAAEMLVRPEGDR